MKFGILQRQQSGWGFAAFSVFLIIGNLIFLDLDCRSVGDGRSTWITQLIDKYSKKKKMADQEYSSAIQCKNRKTNNTLKAVESQQPLLIKQLNLT